MSMMLGNTWPGAAADVPRDKDDDESESFSWQPHTDLFLDALLPWREQLRGAVAALVADGLSDEQARALLVHAFKSQGGEQKQ